MDKNAKTLLGVSSLVLGILFGVNHVAQNNDNGGSWLSWALVFIGLGLLFFAWIWIEERRAKEHAEAIARQAAEEAARKMNEAQALARTKTLEAAHASPAAVHIAEHDAEVAHEAVVHAHEVLEAVEHPAPSAPEPELFAVSHPSNPIYDPSQAHEDSAPVAEEESPAPVTEEALARMAEESPAPVAEESPAPVAAGVTENPVEQSSQENSPKLTGTPDDLMLIEGIGPHYRDILVKAGVTGFEQVAELNEARFIEIAKAAGSRKHPSMVTWAQQANLAAKGDWSALRTLQDSLAGGQVRKS
jgi:predicted flap endonuclease-1-like 5' DNA nuclease